MRIIITITIEDNRGPSIIDIQDVHAYAAAGSLIKFMGDLDDQGE